MKTSLKTFALITFCASGLAWLPIGCAQAPMRESTGEYSDDSKITTAVTEQLLQDEILKTEGIKVETYQGVVTLTGIVETSDQKSRAGRIALGVPKVHDVKNDIALKP